MDSTFPSSLHWLSLQSAPGAPSFNLCVCSVLLLGCSCSSPETQRVDCFFSCWPDSAACYLIDLDSLLDSASIHSAVGHIFCNPSRSELALLQRRFEKSILIAEVGPDMCWGLWVNVWFEEELMIIVVNFWMNSLDFFISHEEIYVLYVRLG